MGKIGFNQLPISCIIGTLPHEREIAQEIKVDLRVEVVAPKSDDLNCSVDYCLLAEIVENLAQKRFFLLETLATHVLAHLLDHFPIRSAWIRITKAGVIRPNVDAIVEWEAKR